MSTGRHQRRRIGYPGFALVDQLLQFGEEHLIIPSELLDTSCSGRSSHITIAHPHAILQRHWRIPLSRDIPRHLLDRIGDLTHSLLEHDEPPLALPSLIVHLKLCGGAADELFGVPFAEPSGFEGRCECFDVRLGRRVCLERTGFGVGFGEKVETGGDQLDRELGVALFDLFQSQISTRSHTLDISKIFTCAVAMSAFADVAGVEALFVNRTPPLP